MASKVVAPAPKIAKVVFLGTSSAVPVAGLRNTSCFAVVLDSGATILMVSFSYSLLCLVSAAFFFDASACRTVVREHSTKSKKVMVKLRCSVFLPFSSLIYTVRTSWRSWSLARVSFPTSSIQQAITASASLACCALWE
jgi:hypothetical protein